MKSNMIGNIKMAKLQSIKPSSSFEDLKKQAVCLPKELAKRIEKHTVDAEKSISEVTTEALDQYLARQEIA